MNWEAIAAIAEAVGAAAVLFTLVYLARQVSHARQEQQAASVRTSRSERRQFFEAMRDSPYLPAIRCKIEAGEALSAEERWRLQAHHSAMFGLIYSEWVQAQLTLPGEYATSIDFNVELIAGDRGLRRWFDRFGRALYPAAFVSHVDRIWREHDRSEKNEGGSIW